MPDTIIIVEDDESIREMLRYYFQTVGYTVRAYGTGEAMLEGEEDAPPPTLYILDVMLPGMDGFEILSHLRSVPHTADIPAIFLTARTAEIDRVKGLESGADDYVLKPFGVMELQARVKAVLRRVKKTQPARVICHGELEIDLDAHEVRKNGTVVELTHKEFALLRLLASRPRAVFTRDEILRQVWDYDYAGETRTVDMHVKTLRQKVGEDVIQTVRGVGYKIQ